LEAIACAKDLAAQLWRASPRGDVDLNIAASLFSSVEGDDSFGDIVNGKVASLPVDKVRSWLKRMSISPETDPRGAVFLNGQYQPLDEVRFGWLLLSLGMLLIGIGHYTAMD
jgi:hypothetical protein